MHVPVASDWCVIIIYEYLLFSVILVPRSLRSRNVIRIWVEAEMDILCEQERHEAKMKLLLEMCDDHVVVEWAYTA